MESLLKRLHLLRVFENLKFQIGLFRARMRELNGDHRAAASLMETIQAPPQFVSLRDAYLLRMRVLSHEPELGPMIVQEAQSLAWYRQPESLGDEYARDYCKYMFAGVEGNGPARRRWAQRLKHMKVKSLYHGALKVTD